MHHCGIIYINKLTGADQLSVLTGGFPLTPRRSHFRGIFGFLLVQAGFVPGKTKKGEKHRKGTLTDDRGSAHANLTFKLEETAMSKKNKQKQQGGQTQTTDTAEK